MEFETSHTIAVPRAAVWAALMENGRLSSAMPHLHLLETIDNRRYRGILNIGLGPLGGNYEGEIALSGIEPLDGFRIDFEGRGARGNFRGNGRIHLHPQDQATIIHCEGAVQFEGKLADLPPRMLQANINAIIRRSVEGLQRELGLLTDEPDQIPTTNVSLDNAGTAVVALIGFIMLGGLIIGLVSRKKKRRAQA